MALTRRRNDGQGIALSSSIQTILTFGSGLQTGGGVLQEIQFVNTGSTARTLTAYLVESGGSATTTRIIFRQVVAGNDVAKFVGPQYANSSATVRASQSAGTDVVAHVVAFEVS